VSGMNHVFSVAQRTCSGYLIGKYYLETWNLLLICLQDFPSLAAYSIYRRGYNAILRTRSQFIPK